ncbi:pilus assembly protein TadG-related protein [Mesorhizobium sp. M0152]|uniref:TadE/TadG family type IV pilus assembly protein n=1 Tax=Mesorhizobium sp. M0152 TaxID=2956898 RepID=UPI00333D78E4
MLGTIRAFWNDQRGIALILLSVMLPAIIGFSLLAIDMSRVNSLHNDMQKGADAFALAAAAELDGNSNAITRANYAVTTLLLTNSTKFSTSGDHTLVPSDLIVTYLYGIPASDSIGLDANGLDANGVSWKTTDPKTAKFAEVTVNPTAFAAIFPASFLGGSNGFNVQTQAVAGFSSALCQFTPMFICNPYASLSALQTALSGTKKPMIWLKEQGGNDARYLPGNYGFLASPEGDKDTAAITEMFAVTNPPACYDQSGVTTRPGDIPPVNNGINTRFDIYDNSGAYKTDPAINPPAPNVRKGMDVKNPGKSNCSYVAPANGQEKNYMALPRDNCFTSGGCSQAGALGDGNWNFIGTKAKPGYWDTNWSKDSGSGVITACGASPSRYCVYKYEIEHKADLTSTFEQTAPKCNSTTQPADRRLLYVAIVDCDSNVVKNKGAKGGNQTLPVQAFASVFVTEQAGGPPDADIYGEMEDISTVVGQGTLKKLQRNEAQLYR